MVFNIHLNTPKMKSVPFVYLIFCSFVLYSNCECIGLDGVNCSYGFAWNSAWKMCLPCEDGFTGPGCREPCPFPYFGRGCLMECNCTFKQCPHHHPKHGCNASKGTTTYELSSTLLQRDIQTTPDLSTLFQSEIRNQKDQEQRQTTYTLKIPIVLLTTMAFILLVFHVFTYSKCYKKCIF